MTAAAGEATPPLALWYEIPACDGGGFTNRHLKVRAARTKGVTTMVAPIGERLADVWDRALLLLGFAGALRRSELVAVDIDDVTKDDDGLRIVLRRSKTDQEGETRTVGLPYGSHPPLARCARGGPGLPSQPSTPAPPSGPWTGTVGFA
jgi:hypothetical protein